MKSDEELGLFVIEHDEKGYRVLAVEWETMTMTEFVRTPEWDGPNYIHRKAWFDEDDELDGKDSVYSLETDEDYKDMYESGCLNEMNKFGDHKEEILKRWREKRK